MNNEIEGEIWKEIDGWMSYQVSNIGRVRSVFFGGPSNGYRVLINQVTKLGYHFVGFYDCGRRKRAPVHQLVANAFCDPRQAHHTEVRHLDGNPGNNLWTNLKWGTRKENHDDMVRHGRLIFGEDCEKAKITNEQAKKIFASTERNGVIAERYGVSDTAVFSIRTAKSWKQINGIEPSPTAHLHKKGNDPTKLTAELAREIFVSVESNRDIAERLGVSEPFISRIRSGKKWSAETEGLEATEREKLIAEHGRQLACPLKTLTEENVREIFMSPLPGSEIAKKFDVSEGHVSQIRARLVSSILTKDLTPPAREKQNHKITSEIARQVFLDTRAPKFIAEEFGITRTLVSYIKNRKAWAKATKDLPGVVPGC